MKNAKIIVSTIVIGLASAANLFAFPSFPGGGGVPELNPMAIGSALVLVIGGTLVMTGRKNKKK